MGKKDKERKTVLPEIKEGKPFVGGLLKPPLLYILLGVIILLAAYLRLPHLSADPPENLSWSLSVYTDEGAIVINARDKVLFGQWKMDDFFRMGISSVLSFAYFLIFKIFKIGFVQMRILPALLSLGTILLIFFVLKKEGSIKAAIFSSFFLAVSYVYVMHNRLALEETSLIFFLFLTLFFIQSGKDRRIYFLPAGLFFILAVLCVKISGIFLFPVIILEILRWAWIEKEDRKKKLLQGYLFFALGLATGIIIWLLVIFLPYKAAVIGYLKAGTFQSSAGRAENLGAYLRNLITLGTSDSLFPKAFWVFALSFLYVLYWGRNLKEKIKAKTSMDFVCILWLLLAMLFLAYPYYQPIRYQLLLVPPMCILAGLFLEKITDAHKVRISPGLNPLILILQFMLLVVFIYGFYYSVVFYILIHYENFYGIVSSFSSDPDAWFRGAFDFIDNYSALTGRSIILALVVTGGMIGLSRIRKLKEGINFPGILKYGLLILFLLLIPLADLNQYSAWSDSRTYDVVEISRDLNRLPPGSIIAGSWAATLSLETPYYAIMVQEFANNQKLIERFKPTHVIIFKDGWDQKFFDQAYPGLLTKSQLTREYPIHTRYNKPLLLYQLPKD